MEIWRKITNSNYQISTLGRLKNPYGRILKVDGGKKRYCNYTIRLINGKKDNTSVHKLVAETFLKLSFHIKQSQNPNETLEIDHKNRNKKDNRLVNLEWVTHSENVKRAYKEGNFHLKPPKLGREIIHIDEDGTEVVYNSLQDCAKALGISTCLISKFFKKKQNPRFLQPIKIKRTKRNHSGEIIEEVIFNSYTDAVNKTEDANRHTLRKYVNIEKIYCGYEWSSVKKVYLNFRYNNENLNGEIWKSCSLINPHLSHYSVSNHGRVKNNNRQNIIKGRGKRYKRIHVNVSKDTPEIGMAIHRMVAMLFIPNSESEKNVVNHKDGNSFNNHYTNLEWVTQQENCQHAFKTGLSKSPDNSRMYYKLELDGTILEELKGVNNSNIQSVCSNQTKRSHFEGYGYCYKEDFTKPITNKSLLNMFPNIDVTRIRNKKEWDKLREHLKNRTIPIWKLELDGTRIEMTTHSQEKKGGSANNICNVLQNKAIHCKGYGYEYASWEDVINYPKILPYNKTPNKLLQKFGLDTSKNIDYELIRKNDTRYMVWKIDEKGNRVERYKYVVDARDKNGMGRETIENVVRGKGIYTTNKQTKELFVWEIATYYKNDLIDSYRKIPLSERKRNKNIIQKTLDGKKIKIWNNRYEIYKELGIYVSMSYFTQNGYIFEYIN